MLITLIIHNVENEQYTKLTNNLGLTKHNMKYTLCVRNVDIQNPLCAFQTFTVVSEEADITTTQNNPMKLANA